MRKHMFWAPGDLELLNLDTYSPFKGYRVHFMNITFEPTCTPSPRLPPQLKVITFPYGWDGTIQQYSVAMQHHGYLTLSAISSALDRISFCPDAMVAERETALLLWCGLNRRPLRLAPDRELRWSAGGLVWPKFSVLCWFVCCCRISFNFLEVVLFWETTCYVTALWHERRCKGEVKEKELTSGTFCCCCWISSIRNMPLSFNLVGQSFYQKCKAYLMHLRPSLLVSILCGTITRPPDQGYQQGCRICGSVVALLPGTFCEFVSPGPFGT